MQNAYPIFSLLPPRYAEQYVQVKNQWWLHVPYTATFFLSPGWSSS
jgi:hypothetical protein